MWDPVAYVLLVWGLGVKVGGVVVNLGLGGGSVLLEEKEGPFKMITLIKSIKSVTIFGKQNLFEQIQDTTGGVLCLPNSVDTVCGDSATGDTVCGAWTGRALK